MKKTSTTGLGVMAAVTVVVGLVACGSDPKPDPNAAVSTASASANPEVPPTTTAAAFAPTPPADAGSVVDPKIAECEGYRTDANESLDAKRIEVDKDCKKDSDCTTIKGRACGFECVTGAIPKSLSKSWDAAVSKVKDDQCKKWDSNNCSKVKSSTAPTCQDRKAACDKGRCILKDARP